MVVVVVVTDVCWRPGFWPSGVRETNGRRAGGAGSEDAGARDTRRDGLPAAVDGRPAVQPC